MKGEKKFWAINTYRLKIFCISEKVACISHRDRKKSGKHIWEMKI